MVTLRELRLRFYTRFVDIEAKLTPVYVIRSFLQSNFILTMFLAIVRDCKLDNSSDIYEITPLVRI